MTLNEEQIGKLEGVELARACAEARGWRLEEGVWLRRAVRMIARWEHVCKERQWRPHIDANQAREMVAALSAKELDGFEDGLNDYIMARVHAMQDPEEVQALNFWIFTAPLETICKAFLFAKLKAKAGEG